MESEVESQPYILGHSDQALARLAQQGDFWAEHSLRFLREAGLGPGMRVLDLGTGAGDVARLAASLVGVEGEVVSVDRAPEAVARATQRLHDLGVGNVRVLQGEIEQWEPDGEFDAIIGRLVLMYLPDPAAVLRRLAGHLRPGGIVAFQEFDMYAASAEPPLPLLGRCREWIREAFARRGFPTRLGLRLHQLFAGAGLPAPHYTLAAVVQHGPDSSAPAYVAETVRNLLPLIEGLGLATREEVGIDTLAERLQAEMSEHDAAVVSPLLIGAWAHLPV